MIPRRLEFIAIGELFDDRIEGRLQIVAARFIDSAEKCHLPRFLRLIGDDLVGIDLHHRTETLTAFAGTISGVE